MDNFDENELIDLIQLIRTENIGLKTFWNLIRLYNKPSIALEKISELSLKGGRKQPLSIIERSEAEKEIYLALKNHISIITYNSILYPNLLTNISDSPPLIFTKGNLDLLQKPIIGIVGSRNASANGVRLAYKIAQDLVKAGYVIASGFAKGIDTAAHKASLEKSTIAVLAGGIDHIYPPENKDLYHQISEKGLIIAELPLGTIPKPQNFPQRNRIISGLSIAVAVIEASLKSGSLITARFALEQNRDLFVVPGFPLDPKYQGNNYLLKQGAYLLESADDIISSINNPKLHNLPLFEEEKQVFLTKTTEFTEKELTEARLEIINLISTSPTAVDEIIALTQIPAGAVLTVIVELELADKIVRHIGNQISLKI